MEENLRNAVLQSISDNNSSPEKFKDLHSVSGGCINEAAKFITNKSDYFIKWNLKDDFPGMFYHEKHGLEALQKADGIVPKPILIGKSGIYDFIILEWVDFSSASNTYWEKLAKMLVSIHKKGNSHYGLDSNNYIGSLEQVNEFNEDWIDFFIKSRLEIQVQRAFNLGRLNVHDLKNFQNIYRKLPNLLPLESPALLHGDLWSGNVMANENGDPIIFDPAVYYGNREIELSFTHLFGGFHSQFYNVYNELFPIENGFENRIPIYNLYPLLVHVNLFGGAYINQVQQIIKKFK